MKLVENMLIKYSEETIIRVLHYDNFNGNVIVIDVLNNRWPYSVLCNEIIKDINENEVEILQEDIFNKTRTTSLSDAEIKGRDLAWEIVSYIFQEVKEPHIYYSKYRTPKIHEMAERYKVSFNTIRNYLINYWKSGKMLDSLIPEYNKSGGRGIERKSGNKKRGRPSIYGQRKGVNIDANIKRMFMAGLNKYYYNDRQNSLQLAYELTVRDYFVKDYIIKGDEKIPVMEESSRIPTYNQFYYWYRKLNNEQREIHLRKGERIFNQNYRGIIGNSISDGELGPASLWQIDSTIADLYLVSCANRNLIVGRPVLYFIIDVYSRMIVGMHTTLESFNAYTGAMMGMINAMTPKKEYCGRFGIDIEEKTWDVSCVPQRILADRGELMSDNISNAIKNLGIIIQNTPPYRADYKGIIEQSFRGINLKLKPFVDGAVVNGKSLRARGEKDYRLNSNLTLEEFTKIIIKCVLFHNNHHVLSNYVTSEMMFENDVEKIPLKIWEHGIEHKSGILRKLPEDVIKMNLLPQTEATVTPRGVAFNKLLYASSNLLKDNWFQRARSNGSWKIKVSYDPRDLTHIYFIDEDGHGFEKLTLLDFLSKYKNIDKAELDEIFKYEKENEIKSKEIELGKKIMLFNEIEDIVEGARIESIMQKDNNMSNTQRLKDIRDNKDTEKELHREAVVLEEIREVDIEEYGENKLGYDSNDELDLFVQIQNEEWGDKSEQ